MGVSILDQRDLVTGQKHASDAAYTLAMHLLASQLNFAAGAYDCPGVENAAAAGEALLESLNFHAEDDYLPSSSNPMYSYALDLATMLDTYNNNRLCEEAGLPDDPPMVTVSSPVPGATVSGSVTVQAVAVDDFGVVQVEFFVDGVSLGVDLSGADGWSWTWNSASVPDGSHTLRATATDGGGLTDTDTNTVIVDNLPDPILHIGGLTGSSQVLKGGKWNATATIVAHDALHAPTAGVTVTATWSNGVSGTSTCVTNTSGTCSVTLRNIAATRSSVTLTVNNLAKPGYDYNPTGDVPNSINIAKTTMGMGMASGF